MPGNALIEVRRDTAANWTSANPILANGEPGYETDTKKLNYGDGSTAWASLAYFAGSPTFATAAQIRAGTDSTHPIASDQLAAAAAPQTLTDGATISWDMSQGFNAKVTIAGNRTLATPTNPFVGQTYTLAVTQDATGSRTMTWPTAFDWGTTGAPTLTTTASKTDQITLICSDAATPKFRAFLSGKGFSS